MRKLIALATLSAVAGIGAVAGVAGTASADTSTSIIKNYTTSYTSPSDTSFPVHKGLQPYTPVETMCFREGQTLRNNPLWFLIEKDGNLGYVHRDAIDVKGAVPPC